MWLKGLFFICAELDSHGFQYRQVRLRVLRKDDCKNLRLISIPAGAIERLTKSLFTWQWLDFNTGRCDWKLTFEVNELWSDWNFNTGRCDWKFKPFFKFCCCHTFQYRQVRLKARNTVDWCRWRALISIPAGAIESFVNYILAFKYQYFNTGRCDWKCRSYPG